MVKAICPICGVKQDPPGDAPRHQKQWIDKVTMHTFVTLTCECGRKVDALLVDNVK